MKTYPEVNALTLAECRHALNLGRLNFDSLKPEAQTDVKERLEAIAERLRRLNATARRIRKIEVAR